MKNKLPLILAGALSALMLTACTVQIGFPTDISSSVTTPGGSGLLASKPDSNQPAESTEKPTQTTAQTTTKDPDQTAAKTTAKTESTHPYKNETVVVKSPAVEANGGKTYTGNPPLADLTFTLVDPLNKLGISTQKYSHSFGAAKGGKPHSVTVDNQARFDSYGYNALTWDNKSTDKILYLTFDCGYEYENLTNEMLDVLKEKKVKAAFFCTQDYLESAPEIVARMIKEGHIVGNHTVSHPSDCSAITREKMAWEVLGVHNYLRKNFGYECKYFRFPAGCYSPSNLEVVSSMGYRTAFWSLAHADWDPANQPGVDKSFQTITERLHPGAVILLHTTSPDNAAILADYIDYARNQGYEFRSLDQYEHWDQ